MNLTTVLLALAGTQAYTPIQVTGARGERATADTVRLVAGLG